MTKIIIFWQAHMTNSSINEQVKDAKKKSNNNNNSIYVIINQVAIVFAYVML